MDTISILAAVLLAVLAIDIAAVLFGTDSREPLLDDHQR